MQAIGLSNINKVETEGKALSSAVSVDDTEKTLFANDLNNEIEQLKLANGEKATLENINENELLSISGENKNNTTKSNKKDDAILLLNSGKTKKSNEDLTAKNENILLSGEKENPLSLEVKADEVENVNPLAKRKSENINKDISLIKGDIKSSANEKELVSILKGTENKKVNTSGKETLDNNLKNFSIGKDNNNQEKVSKSGASLVLGQDFIQNKKLLKSNKEKNMLDALKAKKKHVAFGSYQKEANVLENKIITNKGIESVLNQKEKMNGAEGQSVQDILSSSENSKIDSLIGVDISNHGEGELDSAGVSKTKVTVNMSNIKASNQSEVISKITDYLHQNNIENRDNLEVVVEHNDLGQFNINVKKAAVKGMAGKQVDIEILTNSDVGHDFFVKNEVELIKSLNSSGVKLASVKISEQSLLGGSSAGKEFGQSSDNQNTNDNLKQQLSSKDQSSGQERDSKRRKNMWDYYQQQAA